MALRFYTDTHIARAIADQLRARGVDAIRCEEVGMAEATDEAHLEYATSERPILVSQDADFAALHVRWHQAGRKHSGIMRVPPNLQGQAQISFAVQELFFYFEAELAGAVDLSTDIENQIIYL